MKLHQLDTPALILDKRAFDRNRRAMQELLKNTTMKFRPHHKSPYPAQNFPAQQR